MFELNYRIAQEEYMHFQGDKGYYRMIYNGNVYGVMYPEDGINFEGLSQKEIEEIMGTELLFIWLKTITQVAVELESKDYLVMGAVENSTRWIEFEKNNDELSIKEVYAEKENPTQLIEYELENKVHAISENTNTKILFSDFKQEIMRTITSYLEDVLNLEQNDYGKEQIANLEEIFEKLKKIA